MMSPEAKVGAFFLFAVLLLGYLTVMVTDIRVPGFSSEKQLQVRFPEVSGLSNGDPVTIAGIPSGQVEQMRYDGQGVLVNIKLSDQVRLPQDSIATISMDSLLGGKVLSIQPGHSEIYVPDGGEIPSVPALGIEKALEALARIGQTAARIEQFVDDLDQTRQVLENRIGDISNDFATVVKRLDDLIDPMAEVAEGLRRGEGTLGKLLRDDSAYRNFDASFSNLAQITDEVRSGKGSLGQLVYSSETVDNLNASLAPLREVLAKINHGEGSLGKAVNDPELYHNLNEAFAKFGEAIEDIKVTMNNMRQITDKVNRGEGTVGDLVNDKRTVEQINRTMADLGEAAETLTDTQSLSVFLNILGLAF